MNDEERREAAIERIKAKRDFKTHVMIYVVVNIFLVALWAMVDGGYFWPGWVIAGWGFGLVSHGWQVYRTEKPISEDEIEREIRRSE